MSVSQPALGFTLSPSPVVLTSIVAFGGALGTTIALTAFRGEASPRRFANTALGKAKRVMSVILSDFPTIGRKPVVDCNGCLFIRSSYCEMLQVGINSKRFPSKLSGAA